MVRGWVLKKKLDQEKEERAEGAKTGPTLGKVWSSKAMRPALNDGSLAKDLEDGIEWIQAHSSTSSTAHQDRHHLREIQALVE